MTSEVQQRQGELPKELSDDTMSGKMADTNSCLEYLKKREVFLFKMMNEPSHRAMLYFLEVLIKAEMPMPIEELASRLIHKSFSQDMKNACGGGTIDGLKAFLKKYPSLFSVKPTGLVTSVAIEVPDMESVPDVDSTSKTTYECESTTDNSVVENTTSKASNNEVDKGDSSQSDSKPKIYQSPGVRAAMTNVNTPSTPSITSTCTANKATCAQEPCCHCHCSTSSSSVTHQNIAKETEAVRFFQQRLAKREEKWVQIKSLAGHLSQANPEIRAIVGPQLEFRNFLAKHPHVFEIQGELVSLRDNMPTNFRRTKNQNTSTVSSSGRLKNNTNTSSRLNRPKSLIMVPPSQVSTTVKLAQSSLDMQRRHSMSYSGALMSAPSTPTSKCSSVAPGIPAEGICLSMTANEYRAVMHLRKVLEKKGGVSIGQLMQHLALKAPDVVQNTIGWTKIELEEFINIHETFFEVKNGPPLKALNLLQYDASANLLVSNRRFHQMVNIVITGGRRAEATTRTLTNKCGRICHVAKLWGIIDLGKHEHVFFDKSLFRNVDDLQKHFSMSEMLYFNAILAPKESRAKWRATQVWKECDRENVERIGGPINTPLVSSRLANNDREYDGVLSELHAGCTSSIGDDTEFEGEMDEYELLPVDNKEDSNSTINELLNNEEGMLDGDILNDEVEGQLKEILGPNKKRINEYLTIEDDLWGLGDDDTSLSATSSDISQATGSTKAQPEVTSSTNENRVVTTAEADTENNENAEETPKGVTNSIGVQTLTTGDIMATQIFHESMSKLV